MDRIKMCKKRVKIPCAIEYVKLERKISICTRLYRGPSQYRGSPFTPKYIADVIPISREFRYITVFFSIF